MRALFIGGTGNISASSTRLALERGWELYVLNRSRRSGPIGAARAIIADMDRPDDVAAALGTLTFDVVVNWIAFTEPQVRRDIALFGGKVKQYIFISSASCYQKPPASPFITESTPLVNPFWQYSRDKIACEVALLDAYRASGFPVTVVRPSLTYDTVIPAAIGGWDDYTLIDRIKRRQPIVVHGDGTSLWTITHARDFAQGLVGLMGQTQAIGHAFHITSDEVLTWNQIYQSMADAANAPLSAVHVPSDFIADVADQIGQPGVRGGLLGDKAHSVIFDNSKIKMFVPQYKATILFAKGIAETVHWFEADPKRMRIVPQYNALMEEVLARWNGLRSGAPVSTTH